jgi:fumarate reductase flavoprotein subunit
MRANRTSPMGGVFIQMSHLGPERVARSFPGMVTRCADCGFDLAGGKVEVVPTAHYLMGGVEFNVDGSTASPGLFAAGEDCGGVHGANRLGGNGVANSTVFGGIAGDSMAAYVRKIPRWRDPDNRAIQQGIARAEFPFGKPPAAIHELRDRLSLTMWDDVGVLRNRSDMQRALQTLKSYAGDLLAMGVADDDRRYNVTWHDCLNLQSLIDISKVITVSALARENSRGAHFREDFPDPGDLHSSRYTRVHADGDEIALEMVPVSFDIVSPGQSLISDEVDIAQN